MRSLREYDMKAFAIVVLVLAIITLIGLLGIHTMTAMFWGSWDQDGLGSTGFWHVFKDGLAKGGWVYLVPISLIISASIYLIRNGKRTANIILALALMAVVIAGCDDVQEVSEKEFQAMLAACTPEAMRHTEFVGVKDGNACLKVSTMSIMNPQKWTEEYFVTNSDQLPVEWIGGREGHTSFASLRKRDCRDKRF